MVTFIKPNVNIPFMPNHKKWFYGLLILAFISAVIFILPDFDGWVTNPNWGTSFQGGTAITVQFDEQVDPEAIRTVFKKAPEFDNPQVTALGSESEHRFVIRTRASTIASCAEMDGRIHDMFNQIIADKSAGNLTVGQWPSCTGDGLRGDFYISLTAPEGKVAPETPLDAKVLQDALLAANLESTVAFEETRGRYLVKPNSVQNNVAKVFDFDENGNPSIYNGKYHIDQIDTVGADVGKKFRADAIISILLALGLMLLYIGIRFDARYAPSAVISLTVTTLITFGFVILTQIEINLETVAAFLSLIGYGINDTIVTFDRVRENVTLAEPGKPLADIVNKAINECLSRTIITSVTTLLAIVPMAFYATGTTRDFAIIMTFGICIATLNSIFVSCPCLLRFDDVFKNSAKRDEERKRIEEATVEA